MAKETAPDVDQTEEAMRSTLEAETQARAAIERCRAQATERIEQAQAKARAIEARADRRISRAHAYATRESERRVNDVLKQGMPQPTTPASESAAHQRYAAAAQRLAERLTGDEP